MKKRIARVLLLVFSVVILFTSCGDKDKKELKERKKYDPIEVTGYGLHLASNGTITLNGEPFYGFGVNWHGCCSMSLSSPNAEEYWKALADNGIPYVRMMFGVFYDNQYNDYDKNPEKYFQKMDAAVAYAEKYHIGIVASLMWQYHALPTHLNLSLDYLTFRDSELMQYIEKYLSQVIDRYKDSPAIWMWEIGNEASEGPNTVTYITEREGYKSLETWTYEDLSKYYRIVGDIIHEHDPYRIITGGDMSPRQASNALRDHGAWSPLDNYDDTLESITYLNPGYVNCSSVHYPDIEKYLDYYIQAAKELNIGFWVGEFHGTLFQNLGDALSAEESPEEAEEQRSWNEKIDAYLEKDVQMFTTWTYARCEEQIGDNTSLELGVFNGLKQNYYQISRLKEVNEYFRNCGKNKADAYWETAELKFQDFFNK